MIGQPCFSWLRNQWRDVGYPVVLFPALSFDAGPYPLKGSLADSILGGALAPFSWRAQSSTAVVQMYFFAHPFSHDGQV
jgi:hypothetical protein